jgi:hypothetical protein
MPRPYEVPFVSFVLFVVKKQNRVMPLANSWQRAERRC